MRISATAAVAIALAIAVALAFAVITALAGFGHRWGWWSFGTGFGMLRWSTWGSLGGAALALIAALWAVQRRAWGAATCAAIGVLAGAIAFAVPALLVKRGASVPPIHDITTDTSDPPRFVAAVPLRQGLNSADYGGASIAAQQAAAYPDIAPRMLAVPPREAFEKSLAAARKLGWAIIAADPESLRIEATDTTPWFGFKDDVVIRIAAAPNGSRVDVRSVSRVGRSDLGTNAQRVRRFLHALE